MPVTGGWDGHSFGLADDAVARLNEAVGQGRVTNGIVP